MTSNKLNDVDYQIITNNYQNFHIFFCIIYYQSYNVINNKKLHYINRVIFYIVHSIIENFFRYLRK